MPSLLHNRCPIGYVKRAAYTRKNTGTRVKAACIRSTSPYAYGAITRKHKVPKGVIRRKHCPPGEISRSSYIRHYTSKNSKRKTVAVAAACVKDTGRVGKMAEGMAGIQIGPLREGELKRFGYSYKLPEALRRAKLRDAISFLGALNVYRKLDAVSKLTVRTSPHASKAFAADRDWIRKNFDLRAF